MGITIEEKERGGPGIVISRFDLTGCMVSGLEKPAMLRIGASTAWVTDTPGVTAGFLEFKRPCLAGHPAHRHHLAGGRDQPRDTMTEMFRRDEVLREGRSTEEELELIGRKRAAGQTGGDVPPRKRPAAAPS